MHCSRLMSNNTGLLTYFRGRGIAIGSVCLCIRTCRWFLAVSGSCSSAEVISQSPPWAEEIITNSVGATSSEGFRVHNLATHLRQCRYTRPKSFIFDSAGARRNFCRCYCGCHGYIIDISSVFPLVSFTRRFHFSVCRSSLSVHGYSVAK